MELTFDRLVASLPTILSHVFDPLDAAASSSPDELLKTDRDLRPESFLARSFAFLFCLKAVKTPSSGAKRASTSQSACVRYKNIFDFIGLFTLGWYAVQTQRAKVNTQLYKRPQVPRPFGSGTKVGAYCVRKAVRLRLGAALIMYGKVKTSIEARSKAIQVNDAATWRNCSIQSKSKEKPNIREYCSRKSL